MMYARRYTVFRIDLRSGGQKIGTKDDGKTRARARGGKKRNTLLDVNSLVLYRHSRDKGESRSSPDVGATVNVVSPVAVQST